MPGHPGYVRHASLPLPPPCRAVSAHQPIKSVSLEFAIYMSLISHRPHYLWQDHCNDTEYLQPDREAEIRCLKGGCNQRGPKQICRTMNKQDVHNDSYLGIDLVEPWGFSRRCAVKSGTGFARSTRDVIETRCVVGSLPLYVKDLSTVLGEPSRPKLDPHRRAKIRPSQSGHAGLRPAIHMCSSMICTRTTETNSKQR